MKRLLCALLGACALSLWAPSMALATPSANDTAGADAAKTNTDQAPPNDGPPGDDAPPGADDPQDGRPGAGQGGRYRSRRGGPGMGYRKRRKLGIGTALGGGFAGGSAGGQSVLSPALILPTLELRFFRARKQSFDLQIPISNMVLPLITLAISGVLVLPIAVGLYYSLEFGRGNVRFILSPGAQVSVTVVSAQGSTAVGFEFRPGVGLGLLVLTDSRSFEFQFRARPFVGLGVAAATNSAGSASGFAVSGGAMAEVAFLWY